MKADASVIMPYIRDRKALLYLNLAMISTYFVHMLYSQVPIGAMVYMIAMLGTFSQIIFPEKKVNTSSKHRNMRIGIACAFATIGSLMLYSSPIDLIAITGFFVARLAETAKNTQNIKNGYFISALFFFIFSLLNSLFVLAGLQLIFRLSLLVANNKKTLKAIFKKTYVVSSQPT